AVSGAGPRDFVYFDPPYVPLSRTSNFTAYAASGFGPDDQKRLAGVFSDLARRGVSVLLSNSDVPEISALDSGFRLKAVKASRVINSKASKRGAVSELIVSSGGAVVGPRTAVRAKKSLPSRDGGH